MDNLENSHSVAYGTLQIKIFKRLHVYTVYKSSVIPY